MKTVQTMLGVLALSTLGLTGCGAERETLVTPNVIESPYDPVAGETLWAIAPLANESGVSTIDTLAIADALAAAVSQVHGISALPVNRTLTAMNARELRAIRTPREARMIAQTLKVQGIIVGSVTSYDPYDPPKLGLTLALYTSDSSPQGSIDSRTISSAYADRIPPGTSFDDAPSSVVCEQLDAASHEVLLNVREFAHGRHEPDSALSWKRYTASMELYTEFAAFHCVRRLVQSERRRLAAGGGGAPTDPNVSALSIARPPHAGPPSIPQHRTSTNDPAPDDRTPHTPPEGHVGVPTSEHP